MNRLPAITLLATALALASPGLSAAQPKAGAKPAHIQHFLDTDRVLTATFRQIERGQASTGRIWLGPDGKVRWEQSAPHPLLVVSNGKSGWQVDPDLKQAVRLDSGQMQGWAALFQGSGPKLKRLAEDTWSAHPEGQPSAITVRMGPTGPALISADGGKMSIQFGKWAPVPAAKMPSFTYSPPKGMDVIGGPVRQ